MTHATPGLAAAFAIAVACSPGATAPAPDALARAESLMLAADNALFAATEVAASHGRRGRQTISVSFFAGHLGSVASGSAHWNTTSNDPDPFSALLDIVEGGTPADGNTSFAGINFHHVPGAPPPLAPSFDFKADRTADSGGSPRLVMQFSDAGNINLRPLAWVQDTWISEGPGNHPDPSAATNWDNNGGTCGFLYETTYQTAVACHAGATVTAAYIVSDSGWLNGPYRNWIDNIQYDGTVISQPSDNGNR